MLQYKIQMWCSEEGGVCRATKERMQQAQSINDSEAHRHGQAEQDERWNDDSRVHNMGGRYRHINIGHGPS